METNQPKTDKKVEYIGGEPYMLTADELLIHSSELASVEEILRKRHICIESVGHGWVKVTCGGPKP